MKLRIYAFLMLITFSSVIGHMMVPHHHHESLAEIKKDHHSPISHTHHHGSDHHYHDHEKQDSEDNESSDPRVPPHIHFSASDNFELLRIDKVSTELNNPIQSTVALIVLYSWDLNDDSHILKHPNIGQSKTPRSQHEPGANGLRGPPSIA